MILNVHQRSRMYRKPMLIYFIWIFLPTAYNTINTFIMGLFECFNTFRHKLITVSLATLHCVSPRPRHLFFVCLLLHRKVQLSLFRFRKGQLQMLPVMMFAKRCIVFVVGVGVVVLRVPQIWSARIATRIINQYFIFLVFFMRIWLEVKTAKANIIAKTIHQSMIYDDRYGI